MNARLTIQRVVNTPELPSDTQFQSWADTALHTVENRGQAVLRIVDENESAQLNQTYRDKRGPTNVLSFPANLPDNLPPELAAELATDGAVLGDVVICAPVVAKEAKEQGKTAAAHWAHMLVHGLLHLLGYDHIVPVGAQEMEALEIVILGEMGYSNPYEN